MACAARERVLLTLLLIVHAIVHLHVAVTGEEAHEIFFLLFLLYAVTILLEQTEIRKTVNVDLYVTVFRAFYFLGQTHAPVQTSSAWGAPFGVFCRAGPLTGRRPSSFFPAIVAVLFLRRLCGAGRRGLQVSVLHVLETPPPSFQCLVGGEKPATLLLSLRV